MLACKLQLRCAPAARPSLSSPALAAAARAAACLALACSTLPAQATAPPPALQIVSTVRLRGRVVDEAGAPITGAGLLVGRRDQLTTAAALRTPTVRTDDAGTFEVTVTETIPAFGGEQPVALLAADGQVAAVLAASQFTRPPGRSCVEDLGEIVLAKGVTLRGTVRARDGSPLSGARLAARDPRRELLATGGDSASCHELWSAAVSDGDGRFEIPGVPAGGVAVHATAVGHYDADVAFALARDELQLTLAPGGFAEGKVTRGWGKSGPSLVAIDYEVASGDEPRYFPTAADGRFRIPLARPHRYRLEANEPALFGSSRVDGVVCDGPRQDIDLPLGSRSAGRAVTVRVVDASAGRAVEETTAAAIWLPPEQMDAATLNELFDARAVVRRSPGEIQLPGPGDGEASTGTVIVKARGYAPTILHDVAWSDEKPPALEARLVQEAVVTGIVTDADGKPVAGAVVHLGERDVDFLPWSNLTVEQLAPGHAITDDAGRFRRTGLAAGKHHVQVLSLAHPASPPLEVEADAGSVREVQVVLPRGVRVAGKVAGAPAGSQVHLRWIEDESPWNTFRSDPTARRARLGEDGAFAIEGLAAGKYEVHVIHPQRQPGVVPMRRALPPLTVADADLAPAFDLAAVAPGRITGKVELEGEPWPRERLLAVAFAKAVHVAARRRFVASDAVAADGSYALSVPPGTYEVEVMDVATRIPLAWKLMVRVQVGATRALDLRGRLAKVRVRIEGANAGEPVVAKSLEVLVDRADIALDRMMETGVGVSLAEGNSDLDLVVPAATLLCLRARVHLVAMTAPWGIVFRPIAEATITPEAGEENRVTVTLPARPAPGK